MTPARPVIAAGGTVPFRAIGVYDDGSTAGPDVQRPRWSSGTAAVATFPPGPGSRHRPRAGGITQIIAAAGGFTGTTSLTVTAVPVLRSIAVTPAAPSVAVGGTVQFTATGTYTDGSSQVLTGTVTWASTDPSIATVSPAAWPAPRWRRAPRASPRPTARSAARPASPSRPR